MTNPPGRRIDRTRAVYRVFAWFYDAFRRVWSGWTRGSEEALDRLFRERIGPESRILELGPGTGVNLERLRRLSLPYRSYLGLDASDEMLARARSKAGNDPRIELRRGDVADLSALSERFDFVVSTWVLAHVDDPPAVVRGAVERLAPGGSAVFLFSGTPRGAWLRALLLPFYRIAAARFVDPEPIRALPGCEMLERRSGGLATLAVFRARAEPAG